MPSLIRTAKGFTLIEILVVAAVTSLLTSMLLLYGRVGENQLLLFKDQTRMAATLSRAKALAIETFSESDIPCGYGVHFDTPNRFFIFSDIAPDCAASNQRYLSSDADQIIESVMLTPGIEFAALPISDILYIPPDPRVVLTPSPLSGQATIVLRSPEGAEFSVKINTAGQITI